MTAARRLAPIAVPVVFVLIWSSGYLVGSIGTRHGSPLALVSWRFLLAFVVLGTFSLAVRARWPTEPRVYVHLLITGALLQTVQLAGVYLGLGLGVSAGLASLVLSVSPLLVAAAAVPLFGERLAGRQWAGLGLGLVGVGVSVGNQLAGGGSRLVVGLTCTGVALIGFASGALYQKRFGGKVDLRTGTTIQLLGATITSFPLAAVHGGLALPLTGPVLGSLAWLALVNSIGSFTLLFIMLRQRTGGAATSLLYLVPPVTALLGVPLLGEGITASVIIGMVVSAVGVLLVVLPRSRGRARADQQDRKTASRRRTQATAARSEPASPAE
jgi:drug/metabolite transporter (DMT)-like permease